MKRFIAEWVVHLIDLESIAQLVDARFHAPRIYPADQCRFENVIRETRTAVMNQRPILSRTVQDYEEIVGKYTMLELPPHFPCLDKWSVPYFCDLCYLASRHLES